ncbi:MAG TPA: ATP-binding protein [Longimicrobiaceae bacterium]|nr:ATP-binding protein [Longimicrobiaceae bacterium]
MSRSGGASGSPGKSRGSLRAEILFNLSFLAFAAVVLALWTASVLDVPAMRGGRALGAILLLAAADVAVFAVMGSYLLRRLVVSPLSEAAAAATAIADGDYQRRVPEGGTREMDALATALNRLTDQMLHNQTRLAENVRSLDETNRLLVATQSDLVQAEKLAGIGRLAAGVAHEVGNPLGALLGYAGILKRRGGDAELLDGVEREARRIDRIVRSLLQYARPHAGAREREPVDMNASVLRVVELLRQQGRLAEVEVRLQLAPDLPPIDALAHDMDQVFLNLLANADLAMEGRGVLTVNTTLRRFEPARRIPPRRADDPPGVDYSHLRRPRHGSQRDAHRLEAGDEIVQVVVADTGPGIPPELVEAVFDPFFTTRQPGEGTGLGLAIVASTVTEFGGRVEVTSADGGGAVFTLSFPTGREQS